MIKADYITKTFGSVQVLKGVTLEVAPAEVLCITGASVREKPRCYKYWERF